MTDPYTLQPAPAPAAPSAPAAPQPVAKSPAAPPAAPPAHQGGAGARRLAPLLLIALLAAAGWWAYTAWYAPLQASGPTALLASGTLEADEVLVGFELPGRITALAVEGDPVAEGDVVARLDDTLIQTQIQQANVAQLQQLQIQADKYLLRAPMNGIVTRSPLHQGEVVTPGQTVLALADLNTLDLVAYVLEKDLGQVQVGQPVTVTADPFPGRTFAGVVTSINQRAEFTPRNIQTQADRLNLVFGVKVRVQNPDGALKPGMPADATFGPLP